MKWANDLNRYFNQEDTKMANQHLKRFSASLVIREMNLKSQLDATTYSLERLKFRRLKMPIVGKDVKQLEFSYTASRITDLYSHFGEQFGSFLESYT